MPLPPASLHSATFRAKEDYNPCRVGSSGLLVDYRPGDPNTEYFIQLIALDVNGQATGSPLMPMR